MQLNRIIIAGNLCRDVEVRFSAKGTAVADMSFASNTTWGSGEDKKQESCFIQVQAFGPTAEACGKCLKKGSHILVEGRLRYEEWQSKDGEKRRAHKILADRVHFLDPKPQAEGAQEHPKHEAQADAEDDNDIPF